MLSLAQIAIDMREICKNENNTFGKWKTEEHNYS